MEFTLTHTINLQAFLNSGPKTRGGGGDGKGGGMGKGGMGKGGGHVSQVNDKISVSIFPQWSQTCFSIYSVSNIQSYL